MLKMWWVGVSGIGGPGHATPLSQRGQKSAHERTLSPYWASDVEPHRPMWGVQSDRHCTEHAVACEKVPAGRPVKACPAEHHAFAGRPSDL